MIAREGYSNIAFVLLFGLAASITAGFFAPPWLAYSVYFLAVVLVVFILFFFRDPERVSPDNEQLILSPADGKVVQVQEVEENIYIKGKATQISIFLSPLDVHVNRVPASGIIEYVKYHPGVYLMAWDERASSMNERADFGLMHDSGIKIFFRQITGFLARRIVYHIKEGDSVQGGVRFGMMKFGSRMDVLLPEGVSVKVQKGDKTVAGESILGKIRISADTDPRNRASNTAAGA